MARRKVELQTIGSKRGIAPFIQTLPPTPPPSKKRKKKRIVERGTLTSLPLSKFSQNFVVLFFFPPETLRRKAFADVKSLGWLDLEEEGGGGGGE